MAATVVQQKRMGALDGDVSAHGDFIAERPVLPPGFQRAAAERQNARAYGSGRNALVGQAFVLVDPQRALIQEESPAEGAVAAQCQDAGSVLADPVGGITVVENGPVDLQVRPLFVGNLQMAVQADIRGNKGV